MVTVNGNITNSSALTLNAGTSATSTRLVMAGDLTNTGTFTATGNYTKVIFSSSNAQTITNNGTVTAPISLLEVSNTHASGLTITGTGFAVSRANLYKGTIHNSDKITLGTGGTSSVTVQRGIAGNTSPAGSFDDSPVFNAGSGGLILIYDEGSPAYSTGYEVPATTHLCSVLYLYGVDLTLGSDLTVSSGLNLFLGSGTPILRIGSHTLTVEGDIIYTVAGALYGGASSNLSIKGPTTLNAVINGLNDLTINSAGGATLGGAVTVNGTLYLTDGRLINGSNLTMAAGSTINRSAGYLSAAPAFGAGVNLAYSGGSAIYSGYEVPAGSAVLNDLTANAGGVVQSGTPASGSVTTVYTQGFDSEPADWATEVVTNGGSSGSPNLSYVNSSTSSNPNVTPSEGTACIEFNSDFCDAGDQIRLKKISSPISTTGKSEVTVVFDWYVNQGTAAQNDRVTVQWSVDGSAWNSSYSYYRYNATAGWVTENCLLPAGAENQSSLYVAFLFTSAYGNRCHLDNMKVDVTTPGTPTSSSFTINGALSLTSGTYTIGAGNSLTLNGSLAGSNAIIGSATSNLSVTGAGAALSLPAITNGLNNLTINRANGVALGGSNTIVTGALTLSGGALSIGARTLTLNGAISSAGGSLTGGSSSDIVIGGSAASTALPAVTLNNLTLNRSNGISLGGTVTVNGALTLSSGTISGGTLAYGANGILKYDGSDYTATTSIEFPASSGPRDVDINNADASGLSLHANRTLAGNLTIAGGEKFIIPAGIRLTVSGMLSVLSGNTGLLLRSDASGTGSLINSTEDVPATVERHINNDLKWHFLSSPVSDQAIWPQFAPTPSGPPYSFGTGPWNWDFYYFNPNAPITGYRLYWVNLRNTDGDYNSNDIDKPGNDAGFGAYPPSFTTGRGYLVAYENPWSVTHSFAGSLHAGDITRTILHTADRSDFNLVGNPYPSSLDWDLADGGSSWGRSGALENSSGYNYWLWDDSGSGNYLYRNSGGTGNAGQYIAPGQAFFVRADADGGTLTFRDGVRAHSSQAWVKSDTVTGHALRLKLTNTANTYYDEMFVDFDPSFSGTEGTPKLWSFYQEAPEICAMKAGNYYSIDRYPEPSPELSVPIYTKTGADASYTIFAMEINDFAFSGRIFLDDLRTGGAQELNGNPAYTFTAKPGDDPARFRLRFAGPYGDNEQVDKTEFTVYAYNNTVFIKNPNGNYVDGIVYICDMLGRKIAQELISRNNQEIAVSAPAGAYLVNIVTKQKAYSRKIFIH